jgi:hypothetical protein
LRKRFPNEHMDAFVPLCTGLAVASTITTFCFSPDLAQYLLFLFPPLSEFCKIAIVRMWFPIRLVPRANAEHDEHVILGQHVRRNDVFVDLIKHAVVKQKAPKGIIESYLSLTGTAGALYSVKSGANAQILSLCATFLLIASL